MKLFSPSCYNMPIWVHVPKTIVAAVAFTKQSIICTTASRTQFHWLQFHGPELAPVVQTMDSAVHRINHYPVDKSCRNQLSYPMDSDLSAG